MEFSKVSVESKFLVRFPITLLGVTTIIVFWTDLFSPPAQVDIYFCVMITNCAALQLALIKFN